MVFESQLNDVVYLPSSQVDWTVCANLCAGIAGKRMCTYSRRFSLSLSLSLLSDNEVEGVFDGATFAVEHNQFGKVTEHELKPGGKDILVTDENKHEFVK